MTTVSILAEAGPSECARIAECAQDMNRDMVVFLGIFVGVPLILVVSAVVFLLFRVLPRQR